MKILEVFCGTKSFSKVAEANGHKVFTIDYNPKYSFDICWKYQGAIDKVIENWIKKHKLMDEVKDYD